MSWRCRLGLHRWEEVNTDDEWEKFVKKVDYGGLRVVMLRKNYILTDVFCSRCGQLSLDDLEANKQSVLNYQREAKYAYKNGKVVKVVRK